ncbi:hypothetical protein SLEP1_g35923 [Rubroshorea leprosula]|uniref:CCHC-type domain-containing protein n=1 Tax=Rubroshorea leprosula TaxID=152421 RepID=A0AAV5KPW7_9ROSI|nr:hypothetical protein SLEP1_g35923 [Rubroshorea leprosula]
MADQTLSTNASKTAITTPATIVTPAAITPTTVGNPNNNPTNVITFNVAIQFPVKLTTDNYSSWSRQFISLLKVYRLYDFLLGTRSCPPVDHTPDSPYDVWVRQDQSIQHAIMTSIAESIHPYVASTETANEAWTVLERLYANNSQTRIVALKERLSNLKCEGRAITDYLRTVKELIDRISRAEKTPLSNSTIQVHFLNGLGSEYREFKASIRARDGPPLSFEDLQDRLLAYEESLQREDSRQELPAPLTAQFATANSKFNGRRHNAMSNLQPTSFNPYGDSSNHSTRTSTASQQPFNGPNRGSPNWHFYGPVNHGNRGNRGRGGRRNSTNRYNNRNSFACQLCNGFGHFARNCPDLRNHAHVAHFASTSRKADNEWWIDSGASDHVTPDLANLALHSEDSGPDELLIGDGSGSHHGSDASSRAQSSWRVPPTRPRST